MPKFTNVVALYVDPRGVYPQLVVYGHWYDERRDARAYRGPWPVVAHPPCGPWSKLRHLYRGNEHALAPLAVGQVRQFGGVLEHPAESQLWAYCDLPLPGELPDQFGGRTIAIDQCDWGHVARKRSWIYVVGNLGSPRFPARGTPTHWCSGFRSSTSQTPPSYRRVGCAVPPGIKVCSAQQRRRTPLAFAEWLLKLAEQARVRDLS